MTVEEIYRGELEQLAHERSHFAGECDRLVAENDELRRQRDLIRTALHRYGGHTYQCASEHGRYGKKCSCGLKEALML